MRERERGRENINTQITVLGIKGGILSTILQMLNAF